ncbi:MULTISPECIES: GatB/YqeY domain-containing protein [Moraxella]|uniref:Glutamyl-tRNA amidotransferase n=1 Tax=Moraxella lacunata TaxID=477 RepID=A0A1B8Q702_MORLA|nr:MULTISPECIES: GatB/YqeY domain-containing protein [Moraxella]MBE9577981.1 GatB/YqeY domain-containing protein [Moraxella sp. K1664]MBE9587684.1 GatB/YqeY domain-containing protein [Moraxella sp. K1630]MBE9595685.1 GatB/YqeY domain-containing protein [Moraxella sp. K2450]MDH9218053.1 GatB/YqeY domain-containing protein [Moraxella lacunata]MDI4482088.1 GatB/YqeY domain-containing protein [Moraxella lacunata]
MTLKTTLTDTIKTAMKAKNMEQVKVLRNVQAVIKQVEIDGQSELDDKDVLAILQKQIKQRQESLGIYTANGRDDLAQKEQFEIDVISAFLPEQLSDDKLIAIINETIGELGASGMKDMGRVMNAVKDKTTGQADPAVISGLVKKALTA